MLALIIGFAQADDRVRVVLLNGSRVNPNVESDMFQDYDVTNLVVDVEPFKDEKYVTSHFGEAILIQKPEDKVRPPPVGDGHYNYLMQLADGNRIDLSFNRIDTLQDCTTDSLTEVLLDKDDLVPELPPPSERDYFITPPTKQLYADCCDEFIFGLGSHIPKTLWRRQLPLLKFYIEVTLRVPLVTMLEWYIGVTTGFEKSIGRAGRHLEKYLESEMWMEFEKTYAGSDYDEIFESMLTFCELFNRIAELVGQHYGYTYPMEDGQRALAFLKHVRGLPADSQSIF